ALCDAAGSHRLAFYALLIAVTAASVAALTAFGEYLDSRCARTAWRATLWSLGLVLIVVGASTRSAALGAGSVPAIAVSALVAALVVFAALGLLALAPPRLGASVASDRVDRSFQGS